MAALVVITLVRADASAQTADRTTPELDSLPTLMDVAVERVGTAPTTGPGGAVTGEGNQNRRRPAVLSEKRVCDGCPSRRPGHALLQTTAVNVVYGLGNLARGQVTARVTPATWWANMEHSWVWDLDDFVVNQFGHPYQGSNYFNTGRDNGLSFWESSAVTAFGSATWEYFGETNRASLNDLINTTLGGIALGEMFHRAAWLVRRPETPGLGREIAAAAIDPLTGLNRFLSGDASRVTSKPAEMVSSSLGGLASAGVLLAGLGKTRRPVDGQAVPRDGPAVRQHGVRPQAGHPTTRSSSDCASAAARLSALPGSAVASWDDRLATDRSRLPCRRITTSTRTRRTSLGLRRSK